MKEDFQKNDDKINKSAQNVLNLIEKNTTNDRIINTNRNKKIRKHSYETSNDFFLSQNLIKIYPSDFDSMDDSLKWKKNIITKKIDSISKKPIFSLFKELDNNKQILFLNCIKEKNKYLIYEKNKSDFILQITWNFFATKFEVFDQIHKNLVLEIFYDLNLMGINGPPKMKIILAKDPFSLNNSNKNMKNIQNSEKIFVLKNKNPIYDECKIFLIIF